VLVPETSGIDNLGIPIPASVNVAIKGGAQTAAATEAAKSTDWGSLFKTVAEAGTSVFATQQASKAAKKARRALTQESTPTQSRLNILRSQGTPTDTGLSGTTIAIIVGAGILGIGLIAVLALRK